MSKVILTVRVRKNGVYADADVAPVMADAAGAFGVKRLDTGVTVIAVNEPAAHDAVGHYSKTIDPAVPGVVYQGFFRVVVNGDTYHVERQGSVQDEAAPASTSYLTQSEADALAGQLPATTLPSWATASTLEKTAALELASSDVDEGLRYQGRKYDETQARQFPRVAYQAAPFAPSGRGVADTVWDWSVDLNAPVVPLDVQRAVLYQAEAILRNEREERLSNQHDGIIYDQSGPLSESYKASDRPGFESGLARRAYMLLRKYRLQAGSLR